MLQEGFEVLQEVSGAGFLQATGKLVPFREILGALLHTLVSKSGPA